MLFLFFSCDKQEKNITNKLVNSSNNYEDYYNERKDAKILADSALKYGDTNSYNLAYKRYILKNCYEEFLYYSMKMTEKHDFTQAYFDTYYLLTLRENDSITKLNNLANYYLFKAYEKGDPNAKYEVNEIYSNLKRMPKSSDFLFKITKKGSVAD